MAVMKKQDNNNNKKKDQGKKDAAGKHAINKDTSVKVQVLKREGKEPLKKDTVKKDIAIKKDNIVKKEKAPRLENVRKFLRGAYNELKKVHWPTRREVTVYTIVVLVAVVAVGLMIWLFDSILSFIMQLVVFK